MISTAVQARDTVILRHIPRVHRRRMVGMCHRDLQHMGVRAEEEQEDTDSIVKVQAQIKGVRDGMNVEKVVGGVIEVVPAVEMEERREERGSGLSLLKAIKAGDLGREAVGVDRAEEVIERGRQVVVSGLFFSCLSLDQCISHV